MPTLADLGLDDSGELLGVAAGSFPPSPVFNTLDRLGNNQPSLAPYIGALGPVDVTGPARGSPGGLPVQAADAPSLMLTRERFQRQLEDDPNLAFQLARNRSAEIGPNATPSEQAFYDALVLDRAAARGEPLAYTLSNPRYFPSTTLNYRGAVNMAPTNPALFAGANPANFATGNASFDPRTGRWVGFGGGPQTATIRTGRGMELAGIERTDLPYARTVGYGGPGTTAIGPTGPTGMDMTNIAPAGGWETTVGVSPSGVGYVNANRVAQGATTRPEDLQRRIEPSTFLQRFFRALDFTPAKASTANIPAMQYGPVFRPTPIGRGGSSGR